MYNVKGVLSANGVTGPTAIVLTVLNIGLAIALIILVGFLLHIGWDLA